MNKLLVIICSTISIAAFAQGKQTPAITLLEAKTGKAVVIKDNNAGSIYSEIIDEPTSILFTYNYTSPQNDEIADDELKEIISFTIKPNKTGKFLLTGKDLTAAQANFYKGCFCIDRGTHPVVEGTIRGAKMSKTTWYVNINVQVKVKIGENEQLVTKKVKGLFTITK